MARTSEMCKINAFLLRRQAKRGMRFKSSYNTKQQSRSLAGYRKDDEEVLVENADNMQFWAPHPKTGIYFPRGHERVVEDIPQSAAWLNQTYWVRDTDDGVENPELDGPSF